MFFTQLFSQTQRHAQVGRRSIATQVDTPTVGRPAAPGTPSPLLARALAESSNLALDWLWCAEQLSCAEERRFCQAMARWIDPQVDVA